MEQDEEAARLAELERKARRRAKLEDLESATAMRTARAMGSRRRGCGGRSGSSRAF
jgi:hypothetical protein